MSAHFIHPYQKLANLSKNRKKLWVVAYVNQVPGAKLLDEALADIDASMEGGADSVVLINEWCSLQELEDTLAGVRKRHPNLTLGVNYLGDDKEPYGFRDSFRLARDFGLKIVWTDFSGVDLIQEREPIDLHAIEAERPRDVFYCSGVHMKYSTLRDPSKTIEQSALQAMGWVDGVIVTGLKTGMAADPEIVRRAKAVMGDYPLGVASGVSAENVHTIGEWIDFFLVASSLQDDKKRIVRAKVETLARRIASL